MKYHVKESKRIRHYNIKDTILKAEIMRKLALLLNSLVLTWMLVLWVEAYPIGSLLDLNTAVVVIILTTITCSSLFNLIAIYKCNQKYKGWENIKMVAFVFTIITLYFIFLFWWGFIDSFIHLQEDLNTYLLIKVVIVSIASFLNIFLIFKCK